MKLTKVKGLCLIGLVHLLCLNSYAAMQTESVIPPLPTEQISMKNKAAGQAFLEENKKKPGVVTLPNGLQYKIITQGSGMRPNASDTVTVNYRGTLLDGTEFDSSYKNGQPISFPLNGVIPGWSQILQLMPVGSTWEVFIPAELAYGEQGAPPVIGPNQMLIFKIELLSKQNQQ